MNKRVFPFRALFLALALSPLAASAADNPNGWQNLTPKNALKHWRQADPKGGTAEWMEVGDARLAADNHRVLDAVNDAGSGVILNGPKGRTKDIFSKATHGDIEAHIEFMVAEHSNSGIYFQGRYEVQVLDSYGKDQVAEHDCGAIYQRWDPARGKGKEGFAGHPPRVNASRKAGEWQTFDVIFRAPKFDKDGNKTRNAKFVKVVHNGTVIHENVELNGPTRGGMGQEAAKGPIRLQGDHGPVAYRNIRIRSLK